MILLHIFLNIIVFVGTLGILILVHEYGHFLIARIFKVKVERFSIGFGPILWRRIDSHGTEYTISAILLGGYVKLADLSIQEIDHHYSFNSLCNYKYFWKRFLIIIAGPVFNFIFAVLLYVIAFMIGVSSYKPIVNYILSNSIVERSGISTGSEIRLINGVQVNDWESICIQILSNLNKEQIAILIEKVDDFSAVSKMNMVFLPINNGLNQSDFNMITNPIAALGMFPNVVRIVSLVSNTELHVFDQQSNLQINDKILLIDGQFIYDWESFIKIIKNNFNKKFNIVIERNKNVFSLDCKCIENSMFDSEKVQKSIDLFLGTVVVDFMLHAEIHQYGFYTAILKSINKVRNCISYIIYTLFKLVGGHVKITNLHGPIEIAKIATQTIRYGVVSYIVFLALVSINLGVINLLPFPILDGGRLLFLLIENIRHRSISLKMQNFIYIISFIILVIIFCITLYNDVTE